jgi:hypothetical protein
MTNPPSAEDVLARILVSEDDAYLLAERRLLESIPAEVLRTVSEGHEDALAELVPTVAEWYQEAPSVVEELDRYLDDAERWFRNTVRLAPPVDGVVDVLSARFGPRIADLLALRLTRTPNAPPWRTLTVLGFLDRHPSRAATNALIRFATTTAVPHFQALAAHALSTSRDPALTRKLAAEQQRLARAGRTLPEPLSTLADIPA